MSTKMSVEAQRHDETHADVEKYEKESIISEEETKFESQIPAKASWSSKLKDLLKAISFGKYDKPLNF